VTSHGRPARVEVWYPGLPHRRRGALSPFGKGDGGRSRSARFIQPQPSLLLRRTSVIDAATRAREKGRSERGVTLGDLFHGIKVEFFPAKMKGVWGIR
jgi:hypothetical protein